MGGTLVWLEAWYVWKSSEGQLGDNINLGITHWNKGS